MIVDYILIIFLQQKYHMKKCRMKVNRKMWLHGQEHKSGLTGWSNWANDLFLITIVAYKNSGSGTFSLLYVGIQ